MIRNTKTVDPSDAAAPEVIQIETAMGAAIEVFEGATTIEVGRDRFVPVKTTNDLLVLRSDCYELDDDAVLEQVAEEVPFVDLGQAYKLVGGFEERFPDGVPEPQGGHPPRGRRATGPSAPTSPVVGEVVVGDTGSQGGSRRRHAPGLTAHRATPRR